MEKKPYAEVRYCALLLLIETALLWMMAFLCVLQGWDLERTVFFAAHMLAITVLLFVFGGKMLDVLNQSDGSSIGRGMDKACLVCLVTLLLLEAEVHFYGIEIFFSPVLQIGTFQMEKTWLVAPTILLLFPILMEYIFRGVRAACQTKRSLRAAAVQVLLLTLLEFLFFETISETLLCELALTNTVLLCLAVKKYVWRGSPKKGNLVILLVGYGLLWGMGIWLRLAALGADDPHFLGGPAWRAYGQSVRSLFAHARLLGPAALADLSGLRGQLDPLQAALCYGGWCGALGYLLLLAALLVLLRRMLGAKYGWCQRHHLVYQSAFWLLALRTVGGLLYSVAWVPIPICLPAAQPELMLEEAAAIGLMGICAMANGSIHAYWSYRILPAQSYLPKGDTGFYVTEEESGKPCRELAGGMAYYTERVLVRGGGKKLLCEIEWFPKEDVAVFHPVEQDGYDLFLLRLDAESGLWWPAAADPKRDEAMLNIFRLDKQDDMDLEEDA